MVPANERPCSNSNFLVDLGYGDPQGQGGGFCEVIMPEFRIDPPGDVRETALPDSAASSGRLVLRRGVTGGLDLYAWWDKARRGKAPRRRTVKIQLLAADRCATVVTWYFRQARPVSLSYSPLNAMDGAVMIETIELDFDSMEMR